MARCLFKGSATTLNHLHRGIDLMIPLVLNNGKISFLGIQVKFVTNNEDVTRTVNKALMQMNFKKMFSQRKIDRPFGLLILVIGEYNFSVSIQNRIIRSASASANPIQVHSATPAVLIFKGIPASSKSIQDLLKIAPKSASYRGINPEYLKKCDFMYDLTQEIPSQSGTAATQMQGLVHISAATTSPMRGSGCTAARSTNPIRRRWRRWRRMP